MITTREKNIFISFLNEGGYVLDFNSYTFDAFTLESVGVAVPTEYGLSKGKSLDAYIRDPKTSDEKAEKLLLDLMHYYEDSLRYDKDKEANYDTTITNFYSSILCKKQASIFIKLLLFHSYIQKKILVIWALRLCRQAKLAAAHQAQGLDPLGLISLT